ncbi:hypothetical protein EPD65_15975, partial [Nocardioides jejuensis]
MDTTPPPNQPILGSVTQLLGGGGPLGGLTSGLSTLTNHTTTTYDVPTVSVRNLAAPTAKTAPAPAPATTMLATTKAAPAAGIPAPSKGTTPAADLAATSGLAATSAPAAAPKPKAAMTTTSKVASPAADCACDLTVGTPTVNGTAAGSSGSAQAPAGKPSTVAVPVTNTGSFTVSALSVSGPGGAMKCGTTTLAAAASTTCNGTYTPTAGEQSAPVYATGSTPDGSNPSATGLLFVTGLAGAAGSSGTSTGNTGSTTGGSPAGGTPDEDCNCILTAGTPTVGGQAAGAPEIAKVPTGQSTTASIPVYNAGDKTVTNLSASSPEGSLTCADTELAPTESTACSAPIKPEAGDQVVPITVYGTTPEGGSTTTQGIAYVTGVTDGSQPTDGSTTPGSSEPTDGGTTPTNGTTTPGSTDGSQPTGGTDCPAGSITVDGTKYPVNGTTVTINGVDYPVKDGSVTVNGTTYPVTPG